MKRFIAVLSMLLVTTSALAAEYKLESGAAFPEHDMASYWRTRGVSGSDASLPRGHVMDKPIFGSGQKPPGVAEMWRKLEKLYALLLKEAPLADPRGVSVGPGSGYGRKRGGPMGPAVASSLSVMARPVVPNDKSTIRLPNGSMYTPGEGDSLNIVVNDPDQLDEAPEPVGTYNGLTLLRRGSGYKVLVMNTSRPLLVKSPDGQAILNPDLLDPARSRSDIQFMVIYVGTASHTASAQAQGKLSPNSGAGRLLAVMLNTDWPTLLKRIN